jgi:hypothetical protein
MVLVQVPTFSNPTSTTSPSVNHTGLVAPSWTPLGLSTEEMRQHSEYFDSKVRSIHIRSRKNNIPWQKRDPHRKERYQMLDAKYHISSCSILLRYSVDFGPDV